MSVKEELTVAVLMMFVTTPKDPTDGWNCRGDQ